MTCSSVTNCGAALTKHATSITKNRQRVGPERIGTLFFDHIDPSRWGNIGSSMLVLLQMATYDDWAAVMMDVVEVYPYAWIYFVSFLIINAFVLMNMVIGIIVDVMSEEAKKDFITEDSSEEDPLH